MGLPTHGDGSCSDVTDAAPWHEDADPASPLPATFPPDHQGRLRFERPVTVTDGFLRVGEGPVNARAGVLPSSGTVRVSRAAAISGGAPDRKGLIAAAKMLWCSGDLVRSRAGDVRRLLE